VNLQPHSNTQPGSHTWHYVQIDKLNVSNILQFGAINGSSKNSGTGGGVGGGGIYFTLGNR
jgi:hypothetical protein